MSFKIHLLFSFYLLFHCSNAVNITNLLSQYPSFRTFNNYLTQTQLASVINSRQTITVLVVSDDAISPISGKPPDVLKKIMSLHIVLDYYDVKKLQNLPNKTAILTTLFQSSGQANGQQGFLNATDLSGSVAIGSAVQGATLGANLVKSIAAQPYNISVLQISTVIIPAGIDNSKTNSSSNSTAPPKSSSNSTSPSMSPVPAPKKPPPPSATPGKAPAPSDAKAPAKEHTPSNADTPGSAPTPAGAPGSPPKPADAPTADAPAADNKPASEGAALRIRLSVAITIVFSTFCIMVTI